MFRLVQSVKRRIKIILEFPDCISAWLYLKKTQGHNEAIFVTSCAIGDIVYGMSYIDTWCKNHEELTPVIIADSTKKEIYDSYDIAGRIVYLDKTSRIGRRILIKYNGSRLFSFVGRGKYIYNTIPIQIYGTKEHKTCLSLLQDYLQVQGEDIAFPKVYERNHNYQFDNEIIKQSSKVIIINPYSSGREFCPCLDLFEVIVNRLNEMGFYVYSNIIGEQKPLKNTKPLRCGIIDFYLIADKVRAVISERSGIVDWIINTSSKKIVFYPDRKNAFITNTDYKEMFTLEQWQKDNVKEFFLWETSEQKSISNAVIEYISEV